MQAIEEFVPTDVVNGTSIPMDMRPSLASIPRGRRQTKKKRKRVGRACIFCQRSHMSCDESRPCRRCISRGSADQCRDQDPDGKRKRRGRKRKTALPEDEGLTSSSESGSEIEGDHIYKHEYAPEPHNTNDVEFDQHFGHYGDAHLESQGQASFSSGAGRNRHLLSNSKRGKFKNEIFSDCEDDCECKDIPHLGLTSSTDLDTFSGAHRSFNNSDDENDHSSVVLPATNPMAVPSCNQFVGSLGNPQITPSSLQIFPDQLFLHSPQVDSLAQKHLLYSIFDGQEGYCIASSPIITGFGSLNSILGGYYNSSP